MREHARTDFWTKESDQLAVVVDAEDCQVYVEEAVVQKKVWERTWVVIAQLEHGSIRGSRSVQSFNIPFLILIPDRLLSHSRRNSLDIGKRNNASLFFAHWLNRSQRKSQNVSESLLSQA